jgi:hypothetical protein
MTPSLHQDANGLRGTLFHALRLEVDVCIREGNERLVRRRCSFDITPTLDEGEFETRDGIDCDVSTHIKF